MADSLKDMQKKLDELEAKTVPGARSLTPKEQMLDASDQVAKRPDKHLRWINIKDSEKAQSRIHEGYRVIPESEGGRRLGDWAALAEIPREKYEERVRRQEEDTKSRRSAHRGQMERFAESVARELRDNHGINVSPERLLKE